MSTRVVVGVCNRSKMAAPVCAVAARTRLNTCTDTFTQEGGEGGERVEPERRLEGQQFIKLGRKYHRD